MTLQNATLKQYARGGVFDPFQAYASEGIWTTVVAPDGSPKRYTPNYEGIVQVIRERLQLTSLYQPYPDSWQGVVNALKDAKPAITFRPSGYTPTICSVIDLISDKYSGTVNLETRQKFPQTYEGIIQAITTYMNPSLVNAPYPDTFEGVIAAFFDAQV